MNICPLWKAASTAVYLKKQNPQSTDDDLFVELKRLKPHLNDSDKLIGISKSKEILFLPEYLTEEIKRELDLWDKIEDTSLA
jgi:hypothetical protein